MSRRPPPRGELWKHRGPAPARWLRAGPKTTRVGALSGERGSRPLVGHPPPRASHTAWGAVFLAFPSFFSSFKSVSRSGAAICVRSVEFSSRPGRDLRRATPRARPSSAPARPSSRMQRLETAARVSVERHGPLPGPGRARPACGAAPDAPPRLASFPPACVSPRPVALVWLRFACLPGRGLLRGKRLVRLAHYAAPPPLPAALPPPGPPGGCCSSLLGCCRPPGLSPPAPRGAFLPRRASPVGVAPLVLSVAALLGCLSPPPGALHSQGGAPLSGVTASCLTPFFFVARRW